MFHRWFKKYLGNISSQIQSWALATKWIYEDRNSIKTCGNLLSQRSSKNKWIILLSDGKPNDYDRYEGQYGIRDIKQALKEINVEGLNAYALAIEAQAKYYLPQMFGNDHYQILTTPVEMLNALAKVYERIKYKS